ARGHHHEVVQRDLVGGGQEGAHPVEAEHVGDLVRVEDHGGGAVGQHRPRELVDHELGRLEVHVPVDEAGQKDQAGDVDALAPLIPWPYPGDVLAGNGNVGVQ